MQPKSTKNLEGLLAWGEREYQKVLDMLRMLPAEMPEYKDLLDREGRLVSVIQQTKDQLARQKERCG